MVYAGLREGWGRANACKRAGAQSYACVLEGLRACWHRWVDGCQLRWEAKSGRSLCRRVVNMDKRDVTCQLDKTLAQPSFWFFDSSGPTVPLFLTLRRARVDFACMGIRH